MSASSKFDHYGVLLCKVCNSPMKDARILFCGHSFCLECVEKLAQKDFPHGWILCPFNCAKRTPASIPPQDLTQNLTLHEVFHDPPHSTGPTTPPPNKAIKNREALEKWKKGVKEAVVGLKAELKERMERMKMMEVLKEGGLEALVDKEANKMLETWREPDAFHCEKASEDLIRFHNAVQETSSDMDAFGQKMKQLLEEGFLRKEAQLEQELGQMHVHSVKERGQSSDKEPPKEQRSRGGRGFQGWSGSQRSSVQKGEEPPKTIWMVEEDLLPPPPTMEQWSRGGGGAQRGWRPRGRGQQPRFYRTKSASGLGTRWISGLEQWVQSPVPSQQQMRGEARNIKKLSKTTGPAGFHGAAPFPMGRGYGPRRPMRELF